MPRALEKSQYWEDLIQKFETSGMTAQAFAASQEVHVTTLHTWRRRLRNRKPAFVEVALPPEKPPIRVQILNRPVSLWVPVGADLQWLRAVVEALS